MKGEKKMQKEVLTIRMPSELKEKILRIAQKKGLTLNALIVQILWNI